jgi:hypothetical protein
MPGNDTYYLEAPTLTQELLHQMGAAILRLQDWLNLARRAR